MDWIELGGKHYHNTACNQVVRIMLLHKCFCSYPTDVRCLLRPSLKSCIVVNLFWKRSKASDFPPFPNMCVQKSRTYSSGLSPMLLQWIIEGVHSKSRFSDRSKVRDVWCITGCHGHTSSLIVLVNQDTNRFK